MLILLLYPAHTATLAWQPGPPQEDQAHCGANAAVCVGEMCPIRTVPPHRVYVNTPRIQRRPLAQAGRQLRLMTRPPW